MVSIGIERGTSRTVVATVDGQKVAEADLMCALREISQEAAGAESPLAGKVGTSKA